MSTGHLVRPDEPGIRDLPGWHEKSERSGVSHQEAESLKTQKEKLENLAPAVVKIDRRVAAQAVWSASNQIKNLLPVMTGVVFLASLFSAFISEEFLASLFSGRIWWDSFWGVSIGSVFAGNPINSYIIDSRMAKIEGPIELQKMLPCKRSPKDESIKSFCKSWPIKMRNRS